MLCVVRCALCTQVAVDAASNEGNTVVLNLVVLARPPAVMFTASPPLASRNDSVLLTATADLDPLLLVEYKFTQLADSAPLPPACGLPLRVASSSDGGATLACSGLATGTYRCVHPTACCAASVCMQV